MSRPDHPVTLAVRFLRERGVAFVPHLYRYEGGGARASAAALGVDPLRVAKTLVLEDEETAPMCVVMNGPYDVSLKELARQLGRKRIDACATARAEKLTGYRVGGISPFGQRTAVPVHIQVDLFAFERILVNGGKRGFLVELAPADLERGLDAEIIDAAVK